MIDEDKLKQPQVFIDTQDMEERYGEELYKEYLEKENKRLNNIIKRFEEDLREVYLTFGEFSEEYTEKKIRELKGDDKNGKS